MNLHNANRKLYSVKFQYSFLPKEKDQNKFGLFSI